MNEERFPWAPADATSICREHNLRAESDMERDRRLSGSPTIAESEYRITRFLEALTELALRNGANHA